MKLLRRIKGSVRSKTPHAGTQAPKGNSITRRKFLKRLGVRLGATALTAGAVGEAAKWASKSKKEIKSASEALKGKGMNPAAGRIMYRAGLDLRETAAFEGIASKAFGIKQGSLTEDNFRAIALEIRRSRPKSKILSREEYQRKIGGLINTDTMALKSASKNKRAMLSFRLALNTALLQEPDGYALAKRIWTCNFLLVV